MAARKPAKKRATKAPSIVSYTRKVQADPRVKAWQKKIDELEKRVKAAKKEMAKAVAAARKKISAQRK